MLRKITITAITCSLALQNFALAEDRTNGIGDKQILEAQTKLASVKGNLVSVNEQLFTIEKEIRSKKGNGSIATGVGIVASTASLIGTALGLYGITMSRMEGAGFAIVGGLIIQIIATVPAMVSYSVGLAQDSKVDPGSKYSNDMADLRKKLSDLKLTGTSDEGTQVAAGQIEEKLNKLESAFKDQSLTQDQNQKKEIVAIGAQLVSAAVLLASMMNKNSAKNELLAILTVGTAVAHIAEASLRLSDSGKDKLLSEISSTRESLGNIINTIK